MEGVQKITKLSFETEAGEVIEWQGKGTAYLTKTSFKTDPKEGTPAQPVAFITAHLNVPQGE